uniref:Uncharacterized protein n=1 Tax=Anguilla anguilla TaxID=7936 RepID=A0A0E9RW58_ANGAN
MQAIANISTRLRARTLTHKHTHTHTLYITLQAFSRRSYLELLTQLLHTHTHTHAHTHL